MSSAQTVSVELFETPVEEPFEVYVTWRRGVPIAAVLREVARRVERIEWARPDGAGEGVEITVEVGAEGGSVLRLVQPAEGGTG